MRLSTAKEPRMPSTWRSSRRGSLLLAMACYGSLHAQSFRTSLPTPSAPTIRPSPFPPTRRRQSTIPCLKFPKGGLNWTTYEGKYFSYKIGLVFLLDYDGFWQDSNNLVQVGRQNDQWDLRSERIALGGRIGHNLPIIYLLATEFKGFDRPPGARSFGSTDISLTVALGRPRYGSITVGKNKGDLLLRDGGRFRQSPPDGAAPQSLLHLTQRRG